MISFIVPAYNEEHNLVATVETIRAAAAQAKLDAIEIVIVDDGSTDGTSKVIDRLVAEHSDIRPISQPTNQGLGASIRAGIAVASAPSFMVVPGDNDVAKDMIVLMLLVRNQADMILTTPLNKELRSVSRNIVSMIYQMVYMTVFRVFVGYISGPGLWPTSKARQIGLKARRFAIISEMNVKLLRSGCSYAEVPGYLQGAPPVRRTITLRNFTEVALSFAQLIVDIHITGGNRFAARPLRKKIDFVRRLS